ncbi:MAG: class I SAM-dependent methyltransferase [Saprospiraceae bacterium]|nr:class I SAM-dependent methyltransferase [Saprospiraceae bacterium]
MANNAMASDTTPRDWSKVEVYYDNFLERLVRDFLFGNRRIMAAIRFALGQFGHRPVQILDIGCGLGWTSFEMARHFTGAKVQGIDLSGQLIDTASQLFRRQNLVYQKTDVTSAAFVFDRRFDAVLLIDVYEHIPAEDRQAFHQSLRRLLAPHARVVLTCPTVFHQQWLRDNQPEGLQPVDEDLVLADMLKMAEDLGGRLCVFAQQSIWHGNDYFHAMIDLQPQWGERPASRPKTVTPRWYRLWMVFSRLPLRINPLRKPGQWAYYLKTWFSGM